MKADIWKCGSFTFKLDKPIVMGILNVTPDSFSDGGRHDSFVAALAHAEELIAAGADIIDVGGESTRPGSAEVSPDEETRRTVAVVEALAERGYAVSIDTRHVQVAKACLDAGACIINDVSGFRDEQMRALAAASDAGLVVMHMAGEPRSMQDAPHYDDVVGEVEAYLLDQASALESLGVPPERICLDPGVGFGKHPDHNHLLLKATARLAGKGYPLMVAVSRKSYIGSVCAVSVPEHRDMASALCAAQACADGARIIRAHDVAATVRALAQSRRAIIAMGSNIGDPVAHLDAAVRAIGMGEGVWPVAVSSYYLSEPAYHHDQASFVNAVAIVRTMLAPHDLLEFLQGIENEQGRIRSIENGPRSLDLDIVDYEGVSDDDPSLTLPHPGALERDFVVTPLLELLGAVTFADGRAVTRASVKVGKVESMLKPR